MPVFSCYLFSRDHLFSAATPLWLTSKGEVPSQSFFLSRFHLYFPKILAVPPYTLGVPLILRSFRLLTMSFVQLVGGPLMLGSFIFVFTLPCYTLYCTAINLFSFAFSLFSYLLLSPVNFLILSHQKKKKKKNLLLIATTCTQKKCKIHLLGALLARVTWVVHHYLRLGLGWLDWSNLK